jgi:sialic acid synthase
MRVIAEVGCNHKGDIEIAKEHMRIAKEVCNADVVKFQKRTNRELLSEEEFDAPHPVPYNSYGATYGEHREFLEFSMDQHMELMRYAEELGIDYSASVWDMTSTKQLVKLNPSLIKIPSPRNTQYEMLEYLVKNYAGEIHLSLGMTTRKEEVRIMKVLDPVRERVVLYACTSGYPVDFKDVCLYEVKRLKETWGNAVLGIGFSGHHLGIAVDMGAITLGATVLERHFTLDRTWKGTDHAASLEPDGLRRLVRDSKAMTQALTYKNQQILEVEQVQRDKFKK